jgi:hypothetical protein
MKLPAILKSISLIEIVVIVIFILYIVFPVPTPGGISPYVESPLGMVSILLVLIYLFLNANHILAVLFIFVGYELLRRSGKNSSVLSNPLEKRIDVRPVLKPTIVTNIQDKPNPDPMPNGNGPTNAYIQFTQPNSEREQEMVDANIPLNSPILEVEVVREMAPVGRGDAISFTASEFKPVSDNLKGAANF